MLPLLDLCVEVKKMPPLQSSSLKRGKEEEEVKAEKNKKRRVHRGRPFSAAI